MGSLTLAHSSSAMTAAQIAEVLLNMFSPVPHSEQITCQVGDPNRQDLRIADALHRSNNLSQISSALGSVGILRRFGLSVAAHTSAAKALSRAYAELGAPDVTGVDVPCAPLLEVIAMQLVTLFGDARSIQMQTCIDQVNLPADHRRALTLIASELIINALKYASAPALVGSISITLRRTEDTITLIVADTGPGLPTQQAREGSGTSLMEKLAAILGAHIHRISTKTGLTVEVVMPR